MRAVDVAVVGGGILGLATARALLQARPGLDLVVLEKEDGPAQHQSGRNSGVIHSGIYYRPGSLKARTVTAGRRALFDLCEENGIPYRMSGKVIVACNDGERAGLRRLLERGQGSGVDAELIDRARLAELEPHAVGVEALHVPGAGVVDFAQVCAVLARLLEQAGGRFRARCGVVALDEHERSVVVTTDDGEVEAKAAVNCAGLHSDRLAAGPGRGRDRTLRIVPFRGEYRLLSRNRSDLVLSMVYPVPDPRFPFLGPHFTRGIDDEVHAGPNAVLALAREGYTWGRVDPADTWDLIRFPGFVRLVARHWRTGLAEVHRSLSTSALVRALQRLVPAVQRGDLLNAPAGVRAQAVDRSGALVDDFVFEQSPRVVHVLNAPSPAATASLEIGRIVAGHVLERL